MRAELEDNSTAQKFWIGDKGLIDRFINTSIFDKFLHVARQDFAMAYTKLDQKELRKFLAGGFFEELGFWFYSNILAKDGKILIPPQLTGRIFERLYIGRRVSSDEFLNLTFGISRYSIPDGITFRVSRSRKAVLESWVEYKCGDLRSTDSKQYRVYEGDYLRENFDVISKKINPSLSRFADIIQASGREFPPACEFPSEISLRGGKIPVIYVVTADAVVPSELSQRRVVRVPITKRTVGLFINDLCSYLYSSFNSRN